MESEEDTQAVGAPWFPGWKEAVHASNLTLSTVAELRDPHTHGWNVTALQGIFDQQAITNILQADLHVTCDEHIPDLVVWTDTKYGRYTVKTGYEILQKQKIPQSQPAPNPFWSLTLLPKVIMFLWRAGQQALLVQSVLHRRANRISPIYRDCLPHVVPLPTCFFKDL
jgi:zinc-binding in reverse transcriptase